MEYNFDDLKSADFVIDAIYKGGTAANMSAEPLSKLLPKCENSGGFRKVLRQDGSGKYAYIVLYTSMKELEWPDFFDEETGIFRYYGDNREPGKELTNTKKKGNKILENVFANLNIGKELENIPPFFVFKKTGSGRDIQFLGLAVPGNPKIPPDKDLVAFWRTIKEKRFQNYEAYFTILDTGEKPISRKWIEALIYDHDNSNVYAPESWKRFIQEGRNGMEALTAPKIVKIPTKYDQLQCDNEGSKCLRTIREHYKKKPQGFEKCATDIVSKMDSNFIDFSITRPWRDGGRDAIGYYSINNGGKVNYPLKIDCALEAKCYGAKNAVGVREMSRLISRIRYRQFGIMITTSNVHTQAYQEVVEDGHPILIITASDIARILKNNAIDSANIKDWLKAVDKKHSHLEAYYHQLKKQQ